MRRWITQKAIEKATPYIKKVVDYAVKKTPKKFKVSKTIKSQPPHTGTLKKTRAVFDDLSEAASKGRSLHGKEWTTKTLMKGSKIYDRYEKLQKILDKRAKNVKETKTLLKAAGATATAGAGAAGVSLYNKKKKKD